MSFVTIICEFNPMHNGHKHLIDNAKKLSGADFVLCVLSGNFTQRQDPCVTDKFSRAKVAILNGADAVVELPALYATACGERFSQGAVNIINSVSSVSHIAFGSECGDIDYLNKVSDIQLNESDEFKAVLKHELASGISYAKAYSNSTAVILGGDAPNLPNDILAVEYLKQLKKLNSAVVPITVKRKGEAFHDDKTVSKFSSASAIRAMINKGEIDKIKNSVPSNTFKSLSDIKVDEAKFDLLKLFALRTADLSHCPDSGEGLDIKLKKEAMNISGLEEIITATKSKRYTQSRINRLITQSLFNITHYPVLDFNLPAKLLAVKKTAADKILPLLPKNIIIKNKDYTDYISTLNNDQKIIAEYITNIGITADTVYNLICGSTDKDYLSAPLVKV